MNNFGNIRPQEMKDSRLSIRLESSLSNSIYLASKTSNVSKGQFIRMAIESAIEKG